MNKYLCLCCNGLHEELFASPLSTLADFLNEHTPQGVHFEVVGGMDPRPETDSFKHTLAAAGNSGYKIIWIGHSLGAMMSFYQADALKKLGIQAPLFVSIDPTQWGTNIPGQAPWLLGGSYAGRYLVPENIDHWVQIRQPVYPGGGYADLAPHNTHTKLDKYDRVEPHVLLPVTPVIQQFILDAVLEAVK